MRASGRREDGTFVAIPPISALVDNVALAPLPQHHITALSILPISRSLAARQSGQQDSAVLNAKLVDYATVDSGPELTDQLTDPPPAAQGELSKCPTCDKRKGVCVAPGQKGHLSWTSSYCGVLAVRHAQSAVRHA